MNNLQRIRKQRGMTQAELAERADVNLRTTQRYEMTPERINGAPALTVYKLAMALGVNVPELLELD